jgi:hypothetical protein
MKFKLLLLVLIVFTCRNLALAQDKKSFDSYKAESDGYFINFMETPFGIVATDNYASNIYLFQNGTNKILFSSPGCGRYMTLSPDKKNIGFKYIQPDGKQSPALLNIQTKKITLLHSPVDLCGQVSFSQNGKISFTIGNELIINNRSYSLGQYVNIAPVSPDEKYVCYNDDQDQLHLLDLNNNKTIKITSGKKGNVYPQWSPDGSKLLYSSISAELYIYDLQSKTSTFISEGSYPSWINDSEHIIFTKTETDNFHFNGSDIFEAKCDGSEIMNITNTPENYEIAAIASGNKIIYQSLNQKSVNSESRTNGRSAIQTVFQSARPLNINHRNFQRSSLAITMVPGTVPYINQVYDTPEWHYGYGSCAPTSALMAIAYYNRIPKWPITTSQGVGNHTSNYGGYVADKYTLNENYYQDVSATGGGENAYGGYGYMWTGSYSPHTKMQQYITNHYLNSTQEDADNYAKVLTEINNGFPFPICNLLSSAGHLTLAVGYVNGQHTIIFNDPYGNKNNGAWPNWYGQNAYYDWPGYNNGYQNLNTVAWTVTTEGTEVSYNDTLIDDVYYNHGFYMNNSQNGSHMRYFHDLNSGHDNHYWYTGTDAGIADICYVTWTPTISAAGNYEIQAFIPGGTGCTAVNANYKVHHNGGVTNVVIDQTQNSGQWVSLGTYSLAAGQSAYVYLGDSSSVGSQNIAFDAMKFRNISAVDNTIPTTSIATPNNWKTGNFTATFTDADNAGGSGIEKSYYQVQDYNGFEWHANAGNGFFADKFDSYNSSVWSVPASSGTWQASSGDLIQKDSAAGNSNIYTAVDQNLSNRYLYQFYAMIDPATYSTYQHRFGFHFFSDNAALPNRGNSYFIYFRKETSALEFYKVVNDVFTLTKTVTNVTVTLGQWNDYKIIFDRTTGKIDVYRDNALVGTWTDPSVLTTQGNYVSFRTGNCKTYISELKVFRSRFPSVTVTAGSAATNDIRYQNPDPSTYSAIIKSIVNDAAGNLSAIADHTINVDWTDPSCVSVNDGVANDVDTISSLNSISANWTVSTDPNSAITKYWYAIGTTPGATDIVNWTDNTMNTSVTRSGLSLVSGQIYYVSVKAIDGAGLNSICSSDGIMADLSSGISENENVINISAHPNPFNENATLSFYQTTEQKVMISLIDILGREILIANTVFSAGEHSVDINADELKLAKGVYTFRVSSDKYSTSLRLIKY